jgi:hypothetical protein
MEREGKRKDHSGNKTREEAIFCQLWTWFSPLSNHGIHPYL